ncbi:hypothetical protein ACHAW6_011506 [Cyclotella cf. meneghiniana]
MFQHAHNLFLFFLNSAFATASGSIDSICLRTGNTALSDNVLVNCDDVLSSIETITQSFGGSTSFGGAVLSAIDGEAYTHASKQYASAVVATAPSYIVQATKQTDVQAAVMFAAHCEYKVTARSGGHSYIGSSSCDGSQVPCIQIDVGNISHIEVTELPTGSNQVEVGPGVQLVDLYPVLMDNDLYIPAGECGGVGVGGFGHFGRSLGRFNSHVAAFDIVLADGSLVTVSSPQNKVSSKLNDDIWYAVIGGASGSFGVIVDTTFNPVKESDHFAFSWRSNTTKHSIKNMLEEYAKMLTNEDFINDLRWNIVFTLNGAKTLLFQQLGPHAFNSYKIHFNWVAPGASNRTQSFSEAQAIFDRLFNAYTFQGNDSMCITLDQHFEALGVPQLKTRFSSTYATASDLKSISELHKDVILVDWGSLRLEERGIPLKSSYQQGPKYPSSDDLLKLFDLTDVLVPTDQQRDERFLIAQIGAPPGTSNTIGNVAQPFQDDVFGFVVDVWSFDGADYSQHQHELQDLVISSVGGIDHRVFWAAYEDTCLECGASGKYYESQSKYDRLRS